jgi:endoglucanase
MRWMAALALMVVSTAVGGGGARGTGIGADAQSTAPAPAPNAYVPAPAAHGTTGIALPLGKCVNLANMLEATNEGAWGRPFEDEDAIRIRQAGFATVRLPANFSGHALAVAPYTIDPSFMARVHHVVDTNVAAGLNVIIDLHNYDQLFADPDGNKTRFAELWRQIGAEFRGAPANVWFELVNEPHDSLNDHNLLAVLTPALAALRTTNPTRPVIIGGQNYSGIDSLATLPFPNDPNIVPTFHYYDPFDFTHQGATFIHPMLPTGRQFGTAADNAQLDSTLAKIRAFMSRTGRVPFAGEYGAYDRIPLDQRVAYYRTVSSAFASIGIQSCAWGYSNTFRLWQDGSGWIVPPGEVISTTTTVR